MNDLMLLSGNSDGLPENRQFGFYCHNDNRVNPLGPNFKISQLQKVYRDRFLKLHNREAGTGDVPDWEVGLCDFLLEHYGKDIYIITKEQLTFTLDHDFTKENWKEGDLGLKGAADHNAKILAFKRVLIQLETDNKALLSVNKALEKKQLDYDNLLDHKNRLEGAYNEALNNLKRSESEKQKLQLAYEAAGQEAADYMEVNQSLTERVDSLKKELGALK